MNRTRLRLTLGSCFVVAAMSATASAQSVDAPADEGAAKQRVAQNNSEAAKDHLHRADAHFKAGRYTEAASEFHSAHDLDRSPATLFAWAQAERLAGNCSTALVLYERFLGSNPSETHEAAAKKVMKLCSQTQSTEAEPAEPTEAEPVTPAGDTTEMGETAAKGNTLTASTTAQPESEAWYLDVLGDSLLATGVVALGVGTGYWFSSRAALTDFENEEASPDKNHDKALGYYETAKSRRTVAIVTGSLGATLITAAIARYVLRESEDKGVVSISARLEDSGGSFWLRTSF